MYARNENKKLSTIQHIYLKIIVIFLLISLCLIFFATFYMKKSLLYDLAREDAKKTSQLVFENLYTKMQEGWGKEDIERILDRLNALRPGMKVEVYRGEKVAEMFGRVPKDDRTVASDPLIRNAMRGDEKLIVDRDYNVRYLYPIRVEQRCIACHTNMKPGEINGVIDVILPTHHIIVSLDKMVYYILSIVILLLFILFVYMHMTGKRKIVRPMTALSRAIMSVEVGRDMKPIRIDTDCAECVTLQKAFNQLIEHIRFYYEKLLDSIMTDSLTGLYNINRLKKDLEGKREATLLLLNIDRFKDLNDYYGFEIGDRVLKGIAEKLRSILPDQTTLYRVGRHEFALLRNNTFDPNEIIDLMEEARDIVCTSPGLEELRITMTGGIAQLQKERLIEKASIALNAARERNKPFEYYRDSKEFEAKYAHRLHWMKEFEDAIREDRLVVYCQPIVSVHDPKEKKYEALVRLVDRNGKIHSPGAFLEVVQNTHLYIQITRTVIRKAFAAFRENGCSFSLNVGIDDIKDAMCRSIIFDSLRNYPDPGRVTFEILESEEVSDFELVNEFIEDIHRLGARVAIDDFGSGYSNFHYLLKMHVDYYKIDASLIRSIVEDEDARLLVEIIVGFAKKLGIETIAEYVENEAIAACCKEIGIDYLQGYYFGKPAPLEEIVEKEKG